MKILIVDDEALIRQKLNRIVEETVHGMHTVIAVSDPIRALQIVDRDKPEIVLTDIRMPEITGIDLARHIHELGYHAKVIFITGYSEFQYARAGIEYQICDYLLKPVDEKEAAKCVRKAITEYSEERKHEEMYRVFQMYFAEHLEEVRQQFVEKLLFQSASFSKRQTELQKQQLQIELQDYRVVAMTFSTQKKLFEEESYYGYMVRQYFKKKHENVLSYELGGILYLIWPCQEANEKHGWEFCRNIEKEKTELEKSYPIRLTFGISQSSNNLTAVQNLKKQVLQCLEYGKSMETAGIILNEDLPDSYGKDTYFDIIEEITKLIQFLRCTDREQVMSTAEKILREAGMKPGDFLENMIELIISNVTIFLDSVPLSPDEKEKLQNSVESRIHAQSDINLRAECLKYWLEYVSDSIHNLQNGEQNRFIQSIYEYIDKNFQNPIGLTNVSEYVSRNPSYVSRLIKQCTGKNFSQILLNRRVEEAKKLLRTTSLKVNQIAEQVGYPNIQYFNRVFSGQVNMSPGEYRKFTTYLYFMEQR